MATGRRAVRFMLKCLAASVMHAASASNSRLINYDGLDMHMKLAACRSNKRLRNFAWQFMSHYSRASRRHWSRHWLVRRRHENDRDAVRHKAMLNLMLPR